MYAGLISAGVSTLYDLYKNATERSTDTSAPRATDAAFRPAAPTPVAATETDDATGPVNSISRSGSSLVDSLQKLLVDLQARSSDQTDPFSSGSAAAVPSALTTPFQGLSASVSAYDRAQRLGATSSTSLTA